MGTGRQQKIARLIQRDLAEILQQHIKGKGPKGVIISVTKVNISVDLAFAKVYISIFPTAQTKTVMEHIATYQSAIKHELAQRIRNQMRKIPELSFGVDDSLAYIDTIETALKATENPIENRDLLAKRKKS